MESSCSLSTNSKDRIVPVKLFSVTTIPENCDETLAPIIFIPGLFSTNRTFTQVKHKIGKRTNRRIFVIELRNHGSSEYSEDFTLLHCIADFENFMEINNISRAVLAGHSMGGRLALAMALKHPDKIEKLVVEDVNVASSKRAMEGYTKNMMIMKFLHRKYKELPSDVSENEVQRELFPFVAKFWPTIARNFSKAKSQFRLPLHTNASGRVEWEFNDEVLARDYLDEFEIDLSSNPIYSGDTLLFAGELSFTGVLNDLDIFYKHFPNMTCKVIPNAFHTYHVECSELYIKTVSKFIGEDED